VAIQPQALSHHLHPVDAYVVHVAATVMTLQSVMFDVITPNFLWVAKASLPRWSAEEEGGAKQPRHPWMAPLDHFIDYIKGLNASLKSAKRPVTLVLGNEAAGTSFARKH
jgi:hypothetical protein